MTAVGRGHDLRADKLVPQPFSRRAHLAPWCGPILAPTIEEISPRQELASSVGPTSRAQREDSPPPTCPVPFLVTDRGAQVTDPQFFMGGSGPYPKHSSSQPHRNTPRALFLGPAEHVRGLETVVGTGEAATKQVNWIQRLLTARVRMSQGWSTPRLLVLRVPWHPLPRWALAQLYREVMGGK